MAKETLRILFFVIFFVVSFAIYEDQIGKFDWRLENVGCPRQIFLEQVHGSKPGYVFMSTEQKMIAALKTTTGQVAWRRQVEDFPVLSQTAHVKILVSVTKNGRVVRGWDRKSGTLIWEATITSVTKESPYVVLSDTMAFIVGDYVSAISLSKGEVRWTTHLQGVRKKFGAVLGSQVLTVVGEAENSELAFVQVDLADGHIIKTQTSPAPWYRSDRCKISGITFACYDSTKLYTIDLTSDPISTKEVELPYISQIFAVDFPDVLVLITQMNTLIYQISLANPPTLLMSLNKADVVSALAASDGRKLLALAAQPNNIIVYDLQKGEKVFEGSLEERTPLPAWHMVFRVVKKEYEFVIVKKDCSISLLYGSANKLSLEWTRHEALSEISAVEFVDLPLSEAQADIESEFTSIEGSVLESLIRRLRSQVEQFRRAFVGAVNQIFASPEALFLRHKSLMNFLSTLRLAAGSGHGLQKGEGPRERDYFNMRKVIVVSTLRSVVYGIDSLDGNILWKLHLGKNVVPLRDIFGNSKTLLFIQRTTAQYHYSPQAVVVYADKASKKGVLKSFNPITGELIETKMLKTAIRRVELLPFTDSAKQHIHPLLIIDEAGKLQTYPCTSASETTDQKMPVYLFDFDLSGNLKGSLLNVSRLETFETWTTSLKLTPEQKIIAVAPKPINQKVHSSGRVLGNRSVLYKYSNPNLIAIAALDQNHSILQLYLLDAVSGYIVYSGKQIKVTKPIHLVHCENWLAYTYWNEKGRRMEIAVIELYEGLEQRDALQQNSFTPPIQNAVEVFSQAYIFPQGISAFGVTETEQGLTTRSLLVAMPFGGLYGISKRLLDARRPLEMTPELAEEMLIPYRPEIPLAFEDFINYNQTVYGIRSIKTASSGLESTSLVLAYGTDLFYTRLTPSGTFDILKDDFDHHLISVVLIALVVGSLICKKIGKNNSLKQAWQ